MTGDCPYAKSDMTPCVRKDGPICFAMNARGNPICVGCEKTPETLGVSTPSPWPPVKQAKAKPRR
jgi:hypothetical protein